MKRADMVRAGATKLKAAEQAIETAFVEVTDLATTLGRLRMDNNVSITVGTAAMGDIVQTIQALSSARETIVSAHAQLDEVKNRMGCRTVAGGSSGEKFPPQTGYLNDDETPANDERLAG